MPDNMLAYQPEASVRLAAASPRVTLGDPAANAQAAIAAIRRAEEAEADYLVLPELFLCGATIGSLASHKLIVEACKSALASVAAATKHSALTLSIGLPYVINSRVTSCIALVRLGRVAAIIPASPQTANPFGFRPAIPRGEAPSRSTLTPISRVAVGFANMIFSRPRPREGQIMLLSGSINATAKSYDIVKSSLASFSARAGMATAMALPSSGASTSSFVFDGYCAIAANGVILAESVPLEKEPFACADVDINALSSFEPFADVAPDAVDEGYVSSNEAKAKRQLSRLFALQVAALARRAEHIGSKGFVIGVSGGLDSALALLVACKAADDMGLPRQSVLGISMPGFGTTGRTRNNSKALVEALGCRYREISVAAACRQHFSDIGHDEAVRNAVYENAQARERTKILLDIANEEALLDVGTGDLSEAALGWTTFGGDHLAQYGVNASVPKTIIRRVVAQIGPMFGENACSVLNDILATPVSPELLPPDNGEIAQKTEELVGSYELHDMFLYWFLKGKGPGELYELALEKLRFPEEEVYRTLGTFIRRFFSQQFKRNCAPEAPLVCLSIAPSVFTMPSDMSGRVFLREYELINRKTDI